MSGGCDAKVKLFNLRYEPQFTVGTLGESFFSDRICDSGFSLRNSKPESFFGVSYGGEFASAQLTDDFKEKMVLHKFDSEKERTIESNIYKRNFSTAFSSIIALANQSVKEGEFVIFFLFQFGCV